MYVMIKKPIFYIIILFIIDDTTLIENRLLRMKRTMMVRVFRFSQTEK